MMEILKIAPDLNNFFRDMEAFFAWADYSIALDYLEVVAEGKNIMLHYGRRKINNMYNNTAEESMKTSEQPSSIIPPRPISRYNIPVRAIRALRKYGLRTTTKIFIMRVKARLAVIKRELPN